MSRFTGLIVLFCLLSVAAVGCNFPAQDQSPPAVSGATLAAQTVEARLTELPQAITPTQAASTPILIQPSTMAANPSATPRPTETVSPSATATLAIAATPTENLKLLFSDDFSSKSGWYTQEGENFGFKFTKGGYLIYINILKANIWSIRDVEYADVVLEVDAARITGPADGYYGLMCRHVDDDNYYAAFISDDGYYGIGKMQDGSFEFLQEGADNSGTILPGNDFNKVRADCVGNILRLYANGTKLLEIQDDSFETGVSGLIAGTRLQDGLEVLFDNYAIYQPLP